MWRVTIERRGTPDVAVHFTSEPGGGSNMHLPTSVDFGGISLPESVPYVPSGPVPRKHNEYVTWSTGGIIIPWIYLAAFRDLITRP